MTRVQNDQPHTGINLISHAFDHIIGYVAMGRMSPPDQHIRFGQPVLRQTMFRLLQCGSFGMNSCVCVQRIRNAAMHAIGIKIGNNLICLFMDILAPDNNSDRHDMAPWIRIRSVSAITNARALSSPIINCEQKRRADEFGAQCRYSTRERPGRSILTET
jgi:hypothetical protein